jgi:hypothetical protein
MEVVVGRVYFVVFQLANRSQVEELNAVFVDPHVVDQVLHVTVGGLIQVGQDSVLHLGIQLKSRIRAYLLVHLGAEQMLVAQQVAHFGLVNRHFARVCVVHRLALVTVPVLERVIGFFRQLSEFLLGVGAHHVFEQFLVNLFAVHAVLH